MAKGLGSEEEAEDVEVVQAMSHDGLTRLEAVAVVVGVIVVVVAVVAAWRRRTACCHLL